MRWKTRASAFRAPTTSTRVACIPFESSSFERASLEAKGGLEPPKTALLSSGTSLRELKGRSKWTVVESRRAARKWADREWSGRR